eukprot:Rmarinus@m.12958
MSFPKIFIVFFLVWNVMGLFVMGEEDCSTYLDNASYLSCSASDCLCGQEDIETIESTLSTLLSDVSSEYSAFDATAQTWLDGSTVLQEEAEADVLWSETSEIVSSSLGDAVSAATSAATSVDDDSAAALSAFTSAAAATSDDVADSVALSRITDNTAAMTASSENLQSSQSSAATAMSAARLLLANTVHQATSRADLARAWATTVGRTPSEADAENNGVQNEVYVASPIPTTSFGSHGEVAIDVISSVNDGDAPWGDYEVGETVVLEGTFTAPAVTGLSISVDWGDDAMSTADLDWETSSFTATHVYSGSGSYTASVVLSGSIVARLDFEDSVTASVSVPMNVVSAGASGCADGERGGTETDVDCGGDDCGACSSGASCSDSSDCASSVCACTLLASYNEDAPYAVCTCE